MQKYVNIFISPTICVTMLLIKIRKEKTKNMMKAAVIEDDAASIATLRRYLETYTKERHMQINFDIFINAEAFLNKQESYDVIFIDVQLPGIDGLSAAHELRKYDTNAVIIFVTNMAQFAVRGYEVQARDYIIKPVIYTDFAYKLDRALKTMETKQSDQITVIVGSDVYRYPLNKLLYVEIINHTLKYHFTDRIIEKTESLKNIEPKLLAANFIRCNRCYIVNPHHITWVKGYSLCIGNNILQISQPQKKKFLCDLNKWITRGGT